MPLMVKDPKVNISLRDVNKDRICFTCYETMDSFNRYSTKCGHEFCSDCWEQHVIAHVKGDNYREGVKCMQQGCNMVLGHSEILEILKTSKKHDLYWKWMCKSYTDLNHSIKWCP